MLNIAIVIPFKKKNDQNLKIVELTYLIVWIVVQKIFILSLSIPGWNIPPYLIQIEFGPVTSSGQGNFSGCDAGRSCTHPSIVWLVLWNLLTSAGRGMCPKLMAHSAWKPEGETWNLSSTWSPAVLQWPLSVRVNDCCSKLLGSGWFVTQHCYRDSWLIHVTMMLLQASAWKWGKLSRCQSCSPSCLVSTPPLPFYHSVLGFFPQKIFIDYLSAGF